jgi:protease-4
MQRTSMQLHRILALVLVVICFVAATFGIQRRQAEDDLNLRQSLGTGQDRIELVSLEGAITGTRSSLGALAVRDRLRELRKETSVKGVLLQINSPGGTVGASKELYEAVMELREAKPVVVSMLDVAASGGYYAASAATKIYANQGTLTGSIGVILNSLSFRELIGRVGIESRTFKTGEFKDILSPYRALTDPEKQILQDLLQSTYESFISDVAKGRNLDLGKVRKLADGRIYTGNQAKENGLVDAVGTQNDALQELRRLAREKFKLPESRELPLRRNPASLERLFDLLLSQSSLVLSGGNPLGNLGGLADLAQGYLERSLEGKLANPLAHQATGIDDNAPPILLMPTWYGVKL